jgi:hypothetical protein
VHSYQSYFPLFDTTSHLISSQDSKVIRMGLGEGQRTTKEQAGDAVVSATGN